MRLFLIYYICSKEITETEVDQYANILQVCKKKPSKKPVEMALFSNFDSMCVCIFLFGRKWVVIWHL